MMSLFFFFSSRRRHTRYIGDWSSDVCSSDLPRDGSIVQALQTESIHGSGITFGNGALWISSTKMADPHDPPRTLKVDPKTGRTLKSWVTPGSGMYGKIGRASCRERVWRGEVA